MTTLVCAEYVAAVLCQVMEATGNNPYLEHPAAHPEWERAGALVWSWLQDEVSAPQTAAAMASALRMAMWPSQPPVVEKGFCRRGAQVAFGWVARGRFHHIGRLRAAAGAGSGATMQVPA